MVKPKEKSEETNNGNDPIVGTLYVRKSWLGPTTISALVVSIGEPEA